jgi:uncharacterized membrane protein YfhO
LIVVLVFLGLTAIQIVPTIELIINSGRLSSQDFALSFSPKKGALVGLFIPYFFGRPLFSWEITSYVGIVSLMLASFSIYQKENKYVRFFMSITIFSFLIAFFEPIRNLIIYIPGFSNFRAQGRILFLFTFSLAALAGFGSKSLIQQVRDKKALADTLKIAMITISLIIFYLFIFKSISSTADDLTFKISISLSLIFLFVFLIMYGSQKNVALRNFKILLVLLMLYDLWIYGLLLIDVKNPNLVFARSKTLEFFETDNSSFRVYSTKYNILPQEQSVRNNLQIAGGFDPLQLSRYYEFMRLAGNYTFSGNSVEIPPEKVIEKTYPRASMLGLLNTKYVITEYPLERLDFALLEKKDKNFIYLNTQNLPRAFVVHNYRFIDDESETLKSLLTFNSSREAILQNDVTEEMKYSRLKEKTTIISFEPDEIIVQTNLSSPGILVLSEIWYPGWKAYDNGKPSEILRANYLLRGIYLDEGLHKVKFLYDPVSLKMGGSITIISLILISTFILIRRKEN